MTEQDLEKEKGQRRIFDLEHLFEIDPEALEKNIAYYKRIFENRNITPLTAKRLAEMYAMILDASLARGFNQQKFDILVRRLEDLYSQAHVDGYLQARKELGVDE